MLLLALFKRHIFIRQHVAFGILLTAALLFHQLIQLLGVLILKALVAILDAVLLLRLFILIIRCGGIRGIAFLFGLDSRRSIGLLFRSGDIIRDRFLCGCVCFALTNRSVMVTPTRGLAGVALLGHHPFDRFGFSCLLTLGSLGGSLGFSRRALSFSLVACGRLGSVYLKYPGRLVVFGFESSACVIHILSLSVYDPIESYVHMLCQCNIIVPVQRFMISCH